MFLPPIEARLRITCLPKARRVARDWRATHVVSLVDQDLDAALLPECAPAHHVVRRLEDREDGRDHAARAAMVAELLPLGRAWLADPASRVLIHCHAGISRSTAFALALIAAAAPDLDGAEALRRLLGLTNKPWPNRDITELADHLLGRDGDLVRALDAYRDSNPTRLAAYRRLNRRRGLEDAAQMRARVLEELALSEEAG